MSVKWQPDERVDQSEMRDSKAGQHPNWTQAELVMPEPKTAISLRVDSDILRFFKRYGKGYQTRMNAVLRAYMEAHQGS